jgi:PAS domain S-box-containing protein
MNRQAGRSSASFFSVLLAASCLALSAVATAAEKRMPEGVLILHSNQRPLPAGNIVDDTLRKVVLGELVRPVEILSEFLDAEWLTAERANAQSEFLRRKYAERNIRVIVAVAPPAFQFMLKHRDWILPGVPVVHLAVPRDLRPEHGLPPDFVGATIDLDPMFTFELALQLQPPAKRLVIVIGAADRDRIWERRIRDAVGRLGNRIEVEFLQGLETKEVLRRLGTLPRDTIVYTPGYFSDGTGVVITPRQSMEQMAAASTAPLYGSISTFVGTGAVGGYMAPYEDQSKQAGSIVVRLLNGVAPGTIKSSSMQNVPVVDWRQLRRWGIDEERLPPGSIVRFKRPSMWEQYRWYVVGSVVIFALQAATIIGLLLQRARRRRVEAELHENHQLMELAASAGEFGMWGRELSEGRVWANAPLRSLFGLGQENALQFSDLMARIHSEDSARVKAAVQSAEDRGLPLEGEFRVVLPDGTERWVLAKSRNVADPRLGRAPRRMGVVIDITERKRSERESTQQRNELAHLSRVSALGQLSASIAHEVNQPLASILNNAEAARKMLARKPVDLAELGEICNEIVTENHRAADVIRRLRTLFSRGDPPLQPLDVNELIRDTLGLLHSELLMRHVVPVTDLAPSLPVVDGVRVQLQQVLLNLCVNAADAMQRNAVDDRKLVIRSDVTDAKVRVCVADHGPGIDAVDLKKIFEPFWSSKPGGMGMGLAICVSIVSAHRGHLTAANNNDRGAIFCVTLPVQQGT